MLQVKMFTFNPVQENTYLVYNEQGDCCIIDPGCYFDYECNELKEWIHANGLKPKYLLNTHCHLDHVFGNHFVAEYFGMELHIHPLEKEMLEMASLSGQKWGLPFKNYEGPLHWIDEKGSISLGEDVMQILFLPGHSPGHIGFYATKERFLIGGDVLFQGSIGRTDLPKGDYNTLINSIQTVLMALPDDVVVYPGHGSSTTIGIERKHNPFLE